MIPQVLEVLPHNSGGQWGWEIGGVLILAAGLPLLIWPRKSTEICWQIAQGMRPWRVDKPPFGLTIAVGCLLELIALAFLYGTLVSYLH